MVIARSLDVQQSKQISITEVIAEMTFLISQIDQFFTRWDQPDSPGCALAIVQNGEIIYKPGYGMANLEHGIPISPNSVFDIGFPSKQFTAMGVVLLADKTNESLASI